MKRSRSIVRLAALFAGAILSAFVALSPLATSYGQQLGEGMMRSGTVGFRNDAERALFFSLICTCGCPHETLGTCTCSFAHDRREELRTELDAGHSLDQIRADYVQRFGTQALAVPPNTGARRILWVFPLVAIAVMAGVVVVTLRQWRNRQRQREARANPTGKPSETARDAYDEKLDDELKNLE
jgi:cytochrome c-type biogenesis protein CcmH/NrfF